MTTFEKILITGFVIGIIGFAIGGILEQRQIGTAIFIFGFVIAAVGMVGAQLRIPSTSMKIGSIGFAICVLSIVPRFYVKNSILLHYLFYVGTIVVIIGIFLIILNIRKNEKNDENVI